MYYIVLYYVSTYIFYYIYIIIFIYSYNTLLYCLIHICICIDYNIFWNTAVTVQLVVDTYLTNMAHGINPR